MAASNSQRFIDDFRAIESLLRRRYGSKMAYNTFLQILKRAEEQNITIAYFANDLREYAELRNAILHNRSPGSAEAIAEPHDTIANRIHGIRKFLENPPTINKYAARTVYTARGNDELLPTARLMFEKIYTHVPVYDLKKQFKGVLSETSLLRYVGSQIRAGKRINSEALVEDIYEHLDQSGNKLNDFIFLPANFGMLETRAKFDQAVNEGRRLGAVFITKNGRSNQPITGMITAWDLTKLTVVI